MAAPPTVHSVQRHLRSGDDRVGPRRGDTAAKVALKREPRPPLQLAASKRVSSCLCHLFLYRDTSDAIIIARREQTGRAIQRRQRPSLENIHLTRNPQSFFDGCTTVNLTVPPLDRASTSLDAIRPLLF